MAQMKSTFQLNRKTRKRFPWERKITKIRRFAVKKKKKEESQE